MAVLVTSALASGRTFASAARPRFRVIIDNDFSGDPDGLFQLAHHLLSPSIEIPFIVGSHIHVNDFLDPSRTQAEDAVSRVHGLMSAMRLSTVPTVLAGRDAAAAPGAAPVRSAVTDRIIREARRSDTQVPLVYAAGAGLTELAEALRIAPDIATRMRLVWIGGSEWPDLVHGMPRRNDPEYNFTIDAGAAQTVFNDAGIEIWQVPRNVYRQMLVSMAELGLRLGRAGDLGRFLLDALDAVRYRYPDHMGETYILGDSPLVTLTALLSAFEPDSSSSRYVVRPTPLLGADGTYRQREGSRLMRVYTGIDTRLTFADMFARFASHQTAQSA
ncbi:nucleoside hydrolase [Dyella sp. A6]|uniref:nucleoside hydrolase n=1 Tax=Dyella aluminiiresistens TaxID=3069105 RepID=UPI002E75D464|nr:nucleoside hydrolase [Dyella sp. A6]